MCLRGTAQAPPAMGSRDTGTALQPSASRQLQRNGLKKHKPGVSGAGKPACGTGVTQQAGEAGEEGGGKARGGSESHNRHRHWR